MRVTCRHSRVLDASRIRKDPKSEVPTWLEPLFISIVSSPSRRPFAVLQDQFQPFFSNIHYRVFMPTTALRSRSPITRSPGSYRASDTLLYIFHSSAGVSAEGPVRYSTMKPSLFSRARAYPTTHISPVQSNLAVGRPREVIMRRGDTSVTLSQSPILRVSTVWCGEHVEYFRSGPSINYFRLNSCKSRIDETA